MKIRRMIALMVLSIAGIVLIVFSWLDMNALYQIHKESYGIIGGADGPTSIIVTSEPVNSYILYGITAAVIALTIGLTIAYCRKKK